MALLYRADLTPSKLELVAGWLPRQSWFDGAVAGGLEQLGAFRFDDPAGEVGVETLIVRALGGRAVQVPLTYRDAPLGGADEFLIGTLQHSVLGKRWCYDGAGDPVSLAATSLAALAGLSEAEMRIEIDGVMTTREPTARVSGSGTSGGRLAVPEIAGATVRSTDSATIVETDELVIEIVRRLGSEAEVGHASAVLTGSWADQPVPVILARVTATA